VRLNADRSFPVFELGEASRSFAKNRNKTKIARLDQLG